ncbi:hydrolethalus syndrome protein 1 isoform X2 [Alosa sapidissima]|uniref:hydrolethalus syndrome protein 1 isoform X2 n=1 Tax=Alosa sapidissima TaxID=34773 RepID=UPI001C08469C|nr:hydrolethalus syndrome protein 1 isoform X2 [Alosa sapidissima]
MDLLDFSEEEIQEQLSALGYTNIPKHRLREFKRDLDVLIRLEKSKSQSSSEWNSPKSQEGASKSPSAFMKEKIQLNVAAPNLSYAFTQAGPERPQRQILTSTFSEGHHGSGVRREYFDSYTQHTVMPKFPRPATAPSRQNQEVEPEQISYSDTSPDTRTRGKPSIKRKVLRKTRGQPHVCDESTQSEDSGGVSGLEQCLDRLQMSGTHRHPDSELESEEMDSGSSVGELPSAFQAYLKGMVRSQSENDIRPRPKSFIRPLMDHPHTRNLKKTDPVTKYFQYKQEWDAFKAPGEKDRRALQWAIREQLMYQPPPPRPQKVLVPNTYVVPTDKKRSALRWEIRHDLANGIIPTKMAFP